MTIAVKICGLTEPEGLRVAIEGGADYIGLNFVPTSRRFIAPQAAAALLAPYAQALQNKESAPSQHAFPKIVGLFVDPSDEVIRAALACVSLDLIQLHGAETPERVAAIKQTAGLPIMKAIPLAAPEDLTAVPAYEAVADLLLFDTKIPSLRGGAADEAIQSHKNRELDSCDSGLLRFARNDEKERTAPLSGGTGQSFDWAILQGQGFALPWMLAGGLNPDNVAEAIAITGAKSVDVSSGVETQTATGTKKDPEKIRAFLKAVKDI